MIQFVEFRTNVILSMRSLAFLKHVLQTGSSAQHATMRNDVTVMMMSEHSDVMYDDAMTGGAAELSLSSSGLSLGGAMVVFSSTSSA